VIALIDLWTSSSRWPAPTTSWHDHGSPVLYSDYDLWDNEQQK